MPERSVKLVGACISPIAVCGADPRWGDGLDWAIIPGATECECSWAKVGYANLMRIDAKSSAFTMGMRLVLSVNPINPFHREWVPHLGCRHRHNNEQSADGPHEIRFMESSPQIYLGMPVIRNQAF